MKYNILKKIPGIMFIKKTPEGFYNLYVKTEWEIDNGYIKLFKYSHRYTYPRLLNSCDTYQQARHRLHLNLDILENYLNRGAKIVPK